MQTSEVDFLGERAGRVNSGGVWIAVNECNGCGLSDHLMLHLLIAKVAAVGSCGVD